MSTVPSPGSAIIISPLSLLSYLRRKALTSFVFSIVSSLSPTTLTANPTVLPEELLLQIVRRCHRQTVIRIGSDAVDQVQARKQACLATHLICRRLYYLISKLDFIGNANVYLKACELNRGQEKEPRADSTRHLWTRR